MARGGSPGQRYLRTWLPRTGVYSQDPVRCEMAIFRQPRCARMLKQLPLPAFLRDSPTVASSDQRHEGGLMLLEMTFEILDEWRRAIVKPCVILLKLFFPRGLYVFLNRLNRFSWMTQEHSACFTQYLLVAQSTQL